MKLQVLALGLLVGSLAQAQDVILKKLVCENASKKAIVKVHAASDGSLGLVEWHVQSKFSSKATSGSGYLYVEDGLDSFNSLDVYDGIEVSGNTLTLTDLSGTGDGEKLNCR